MNDGHTEMFSLRFLLGLIHAELGRLAGCLINRVVERKPAPDRSEILTLVAWRDEAALLRLPGIGQAKVSKYGPSVLAVVADLPA